MTKFTDLGLSQPLLDALSSKNYTVPTPIQAQAIPTVLTGRDLLGIAQTGTGKTAAFMLPSLDRLANPRVHPIAKRVRMLVLAPTRELASQIADNASTYSKNVHLTVDVVFGGTAPMKSVRAVARGLDVLVATPGRLLDLVDQRAIDLSRLEILVLDEADQMLDLGFIHALKRIVQLVPKQRQTLFFSATMPKAIKQLADAYLTNPAEVSVTPAATTVERIEQSVTMVNQAEKAALLALYIKSHEVERALVFSRTKHGADKIVRQLNASGIGAAAIHGNKSQPQRERALQSFKTGETPVLIATDIAARGIDVSGVSHVVNYDLPDVPEQYVHRIGRTARAGADGIAVAFCSPDERVNLKDIEKLTRLRLPVAPLPEGFNAAVQAMKAIKLPPKGADDGNRFTRGNGTGRSQRSERRPPRTAEIRPAGDRGARPDRGPRADRNARPEGQRPARPEGQHQGGPREYNQFGQPRDNSRRDGAPRPAGDGQRHPQRAGAHPAHRPDGGARRPFGGGRGRSGGGRPNRAQG